MRLSDIRGEDALDVLADIMDPVMEILTDPEVKKVYEDKNNKVADVVRTAIKRHKKAILHVLAVVDGENPATYAPTALEIPVKLMVLFNDPAFRMFFPQQGQSQDEASSGSATEITGATDEK